MVNIESFKEEVVLGLGLNGQIEDCWAQRDSFGDKWEGRAFQVETTA